MRRIGHNAAAAALLAVAIAVGAYFAFNALSTREVGIAGGTDSERVEYGPKTLLPGDFLWTREHDVALRLYKGERKTYSLFRFLAGGPKGVDEVFEHFGGGTWRFAQSDANATIRELYDRGLLRAEKGTYWRTVGLTDFGYRVLRALAEIPENVKEYAMCWNWTRRLCPEWRYPLPTPNPELRIPSQNP